MTPEIEVRVVKTSGDKLPPEIQVALEQAQSALVSVVDTLYEAHESDSYIESMGFALSAFSNVLIYALGHLVEVRTLQLMMREGATFVEDGKVLPEARAEFMEATEYLMGILESILSRASKEIPPLAIQAWKKRLDETFDRNILAAVHSADQLSRASYERFKELDKKVEAGTATAEETQEFVDLGRVIDR